ncbi:WxL domain-containing protein [Enterococcus mundtii]|uniref:WxL domain-containing protein n=1 Tax=Enterococcus mundtii TaxID=53346 RepID=UPI00032FFD12|nr:WxL domain-containing protein [Enterococcus mundtii]EOH63620.1 hypothetical protein UAC_00883 [Enterococcus mundtii ATCC 882]EOU13399.1 hypothetical protein I587_01950 [Enterococcus mundtii ATCC 882]PJK26952.1 WxL domain-containing protein [Enterococcus mundtii]
MKKTVSGLMIISLLTGVTVTVQAVDQAKYTSNGTVNFIPDTEPTDPVNPIDPDPDKPVHPTNPDRTDPEPGTKGPLSIDFASSFDFGMNKISNKTETYYAKAQTYVNDDGTFSDLVTPDYVQVSDHRGNNAGWTLKVCQNGQFKNDDTLNNTLTGAVIELQDPVVKSNAEGVAAPTATTEIALDPNGAESIVLSAGQDAGSGTWIEAWGDKVETITMKDQKNKDVSSMVTKSVSLTIPGKTPKDAVTYSTTLTWNLSDTPGN